MKSQEAFGTVTVAPGPVTIAPTGIPSEEAVGTPDVMQVLGPEGIVSEEAFGTPKLTLFVKPVRNRVR